MNALKTSFRMFLWMSVVTGIFYPILITLFSFILSKDPFVYHLERIVGAKLIGQSFEHPRYFSGRPSASHYNPLIPGASNLGPTSKALRKRVASKIEELKIIYGQQNIPEELLFTSASGLDPHISQETALYEAESIARSRNIDVAEIKKLIESQTTKSPLSFFANPYVNVLLLNLGLDELAKQKEQHEK